MPIASLLLMIIIDPVVSEAMSKTKDKRIAVDTVHCARVQVQESQVNNK